MGARPPTIGAWRPGDLEEVHMEIGLLAKPGITGPQLDALRSVVGRWRSAGHSVRVRVAFEEGHGERPGHGCGPSGAAG